MGAVCVAFINEGQIIINNKTWVQATECAQTIFHKTVAIVELGNRRICIPVLNIIIFYLGFKKWGRGSEPRSAFTTRG